MSNNAPVMSYFIGWDVGGWNCDRNANSRDAVVILDAARLIVGNPWRGNLREHLNSAESTRDWIRRLFACCRADRPGDHLRVTMAIDTPFGFSQEFTRLVTGLQYVAPVEESATNRYLFRYTERWLFAQGLSPLSAVKDMIGSQATKGMHMLARFAPQRESCGVWSDGQLLRAIEAYPSACRRSQLMPQLRAPYPALGHADLDDALTCALVAYLFTECRADLWAPDQQTPECEGWIWVPRE